MRNFEKVWKLRGSVFVGKFLHLSRGEGKFIKGWSSRLPIHEEGTNGYIIMVVGEDNLVEEILEYLGKNLD